jgi:hypothetical protein
MTAQFESFKYDGIKLLKRYCPAVSQSCNLYDLFSRHIFLTKKSMPIVD